MSGSPLVLWSSRGLQQLQLCSPLAIYHSQIQLFDLKDRADTEEGSIVAEWLIRYYRTIQSAFDLAAFAAGITLQQLANRSSNRNSV